jgi:hypothetical protein
MELEPPLTVFGFRLSETSSMGLRVSVADLLMKFAVAVIVTVVKDETEIAEIEKLAELCPLGIVTVLCTLAEGLLLSKFTMIPLGGATPLNVTVPFAEPTPARVLGLIVSDCNTGAVTVSKADEVVPFKLAATVAATVEVTAEV